MLARAIVIGLAVLCPSLAGPATAQPGRNVMTCVLQRAGTEVIGTCEVPCSVNALAIDIDGPNPNKACDGPPRTVQARLRETAGATWLGTMEGKFPEDPTRFELVLNGGTPVGIAKTPYGWFALQGAERQNETLRLTIAANNQLPPTPDDIRIIRRAKALLADERAWNRQDNRTCPATPDKWSLFCALQQATQEISGGVHYRQPALQMAREVLNEVAAAAWATIA